MRTREDALTAAKHRDTPVHRFTIHESAGNHTLTGEGFIRSDMREEREEAHDCDEDFKEEADGVDKDAEPAERPPRWR